MVELTRPRPRRSGGAQKHLLRPHCSHIWGRWGVFGRKYACPLMISHCEPDVLAPVYGSAMASMICGSAYRSLPPRLPAPPLPCSTGGLHTSASGPPSSSCSTCLLRMSAGYVGATHQLESPFFCTQGSAHGKQVMSVEDVAPGNSPTTLPAWTRSPGASSQLFYLGSGVDVFSARSSCAFPEPRPRRPCTAS